METIFWLTAFFAALLGTTASFGISSILLPVAVDTFSYDNAIALVSIFHLFGNIGRIGFFKTGVDKRLLVSFGVPAAVFTIIGACFVGLWDTSFLKQLMGFILVVYSVFNLLDFKLKLEPSTFNSVFGGSLYGFLSGLVGTGGPLRGA
jgi:hypothetical protein